MFKGSGFVHFEEPLFWQRFIFAVNVGTDYFTSGYTVTATNVESAAGLTLRFVVLVESFSVFFLTTSPDHLGLALEESRVPYEFAFAFTTAVRFVPVLAEEAQTIMDAQKARGLELEKGGLLKKIRNYIPVLIPLIVSAIRRSLELAEAMESRAWGATKKRTNLYVLKLHKGDYASAGNHRRNFSRSCLCPLLCADSNNSPLTATQKSANTVGILNRH